MRSPQFKATVLSYLDEIYNAAYFLCNGGAMAEELTFQAYETVCHQASHQFKDDSDLRNRLHVELLKTFQERKKQTRLACV